jgi:hypothetical protein
MSPLGRFILIAMLWGVRFAAGALAAIFALVVWHPASRLAALRRIGYLSRREAGCPPKL